MLTLPLRPAATTIVAALLTFMLSNWSAAQERGEQEEGVATGGPIRTKRYTFAEAEDAMSKLRQLRATRPEAQSALADWYNVLSQPVFTESQEVPEHCTKLAAWVKERPNSPTPLIAQAKALIDYAWFVRGIGFAPSVAEQDKIEFQSRIGEARRLLERAIKLGVLDGEAHTLLLDVARAEGRSLSETRSIFDQGRAADSTYIWLYAAMGEYLLPRWYGQLGDVEKFAAEAAGLLPGDDGLDAYGHIAYVANQYDPNLLFWGRFDRELLVKAAEVLVKRYPGARNVVPFAALCTLAAQDQAAARRIRPWVTSSDAPRVPIWKNVSALYFRWCSAEEISSGQAEWFWGAPFLYANVLFTPDSQSVWCPSGFARGAVTRIDLATKRVEQAFPATGSRVERVAFDPDKKWLVGSLAGGRFQGWVRWDLANGGEALSHPTTEACRALTINPKRNQVAWAENKTLLTFDLSTGKDGPRIELPATVESIKYAPDGNLLAVQAGSITVWDAGTGEKRYNLPSFQTQPRPKIACEQLLEFDEQGRVWAMAFAVGVNPVQRPLVRFAPSGKTWEVIVPNLPGQPASVVLSSDRRLLAMVENNNDPGAAEAIQVWDLQSGQMQKRLLSTTHHIASLVFSPDSKRLASAGHLGGVVKLWRLDDGIAKPGSGQITQSAGQRSFQ